jgi:hypothetical protein
VLFNQGRPRGLWGNKFAQGIMITNQPNSSRSGSTNRRSPRSGGECAKLSL